LCHDPEEDFNTWFCSLNQDQLQIANEVIGLASTSKPWMVYIDGPGGTGKTHFLNTLISYFSAQGKNIVTVSSSGIASLMLRDATTAHARFKIPVKIQSNSVCNFNAKTRVGQELLKVQVIVWDEISMQNRLCVEAVDRSLQELKQVSEPFGGISVIFGGNFCQTLPVVKRANMFIQAKLLSLAGGNSIPIA
jgi:hypothetical protein